MNEWYNKTNSSSALNNLIKVEYVSYNASLTKVHYTVCLSDKIKRENNVSNAINAKNKSDSK